MKTRIAIFEISDELPLQKWAEQLTNERTPEALQSLQHENVTYESMHYFELDGRKYVVGVMVTDKDTIKEADPSQAINVEHKKVLAETKNKKIELKKLYELTTDEWLSLHN